jgi:hypothetical protein
VGALGVLLVSSAAQSQPEPDFDPEPPDMPPMPMPVPGGGGGVDKIPADWRGAVRLLRVPGPSTGAAEAKAAREIFPDATKVWMHVKGTDPRPIEGARRGVRRWACSSGCSLALPAEAEGGGAVRQAHDSLADHMLRSIKLQTPVQPLPLTIWRPNAGSAAGALGPGPDTETLGKLLFDPVLLGRRDYGHVCAYPPVEKAAKPGEEVPTCAPPRKRAMPTPDAAELTLGFQWPRITELADFEYVAVTDTCGNAYVQPFQRTFTVPVWEVATGGCGRADGRVLRVFPTGGWVRVTAFNLDAPGAGNVISATFRVTVPALEDLVSADTPPLLFPDPRIDDLLVDCGPKVLKARTGPGGIPRPAPGTKIPPGAKVPPGAEDGKAPTKPGAKTPPVVRPRLIPASKPSGQPLAHQGLVISPEPLLRGNCRVELRGQTKRRLVAPLALRVILRRTDTPAQTALVDAPWIVTPNAATFHLPPISPMQGFDGESRLRLEIYSDPRSSEGNVVLLSDAGRIARIENMNPMYDRRRGEPGPLQRMVGSVTIHSAPLCGDTNFETTEAAGNCLRGYFTVPVMLATLQVTRAPWVERPLITRNILSAVGVAFAMDSYDPVEREAFPIAAQIGGFVQDLGEDRIGLLAYLGAAPTLPILGDGGNTTSIGLLGGVGVAYVANNTGPDEGIKPAAFVSIVVQVGQANPAMGGMSAAPAGAPFGEYQATEYGGGTY